MADYSEIIQEINTNLPDNTEQLITAEILRETLIDFVNEVEDTEDDLETTIQNKQDTLTFDNTPTENSDNPVTSDGVYDALQEKADKVSNATNGNFAGLNSNGNLTDSGYNTLSFPNLLRVSNITQLTSEQCESLHIGDIVVAGAISYLVTTLDTTDIDLCCSDSDTITTVIYSRDNTSEPWQYIDTIRNSFSTKPNKPAHFLNGHLAGLDSLGNLTDSGKSVSDFATASQGALADTAYQKPLTGIPASDLASGVIPEPEIFVSIVNRTTYQEVADALADGKIVIAVDGNKTYYYAGLSAYNNYMFFSLLEQSYSYISVNSFNLWSMFIMSGLESTSNKMTSLSSSSTDTEYPSAKCVYDTLLDYVKKSQTTGLLKNDGTVDTNTYLTQQDIVNKADKTSVVELTGTSVTQELADNTIYQCSELSSLTITIPNGITSDYISQINFESGSTATTLTAPNNIIWFGDDLTNNVFVPAVNKQYVVIFYYDGVNVRSIVQS